MAFWTEAGYASREPIGSGIGQIRTCPHGEEIGFCDRGACDEGWDE